MPDPALHVRGLDEFRRELKATDSRWTRELASAHRTIAREVAGEGRKFARGHGGETAHFAGAIYGIGSAAKAAITNRREANAAIWGAKRRTGWYGRGKYRRSQGRQHPPWVGDSWTVGGPGGPRGINDAIRHDLPQIDERYEQAVLDVARRAFPEGN